MEISHLHQLGKLESSYWWHVAKRQLATSLLTCAVPPPSHLVEGGIGAAGNLSRWKSMGYSVQGLDCLNESIQYARQQGIDNVCVHDLHEPWPVKENTAGAVVLLDVLEHLVNPVLALEHAARSLAPAGKIIFTVPAYPWLFSDWDQRLGHYRLYTKQMMQEQVQQAGLKLEILRYWNAFSLPAAIVLRMVRKIWPSRGGTEFPNVSDWMNNALIRAAAVEQQWSPRFGLPCGLSLVGVISR
jgi:2-polyprenyl-3-methyl-5-hydroxy-6-metoxy-1,4-benzoquinol methylase